MTILLLNNSVQPTAARFAVSGGWPLTLGGGARAPFETTAASDGHHVPPARRSLWRNH